MFRIHKKFFWGGEYEPSVKYCVEVELKYRNALLHARNKKTKPITVMKSGYRDVNKHAQILFFYLRFTYILL